MAILQQLVSIQLISFGDVVVFVFKRVLTRKAVYFITDQYNPGSTKSVECERRKASDGTMQLRIEKKGAEATEAMKEILEN